MGGYLYEGMNPEYYLGTYQPYYSQPLQDLTASSSAALSSVSQKHNAHGPQTKPDRAAAAMQAHVNRLTRAQQNPTKAAKTVSTLGRSAAASVSDHPSATAAKKGWKVQELVKQLQEDKSAVNMAKPGKAASTKQYAAQQSRARAAPALTLNVPHFEQQAKAATTAAKLTKANSVTAAPTVGRPAIAQQTTVHRAQWVVAGPALKAQKADNAVSMAASSDDDDKSCAACYIKGTPQWRKGKAGKWYMQDMCNRCGMWEARHPGLPMQQKFLDERASNQAAYMQPQAHPRALCAAATAAMPGRKLAHASSNSSNSAHTMVQHTISDVSQTMQYSNCLFETLVDVAVERLEAETHLNGQNLLPSQDAALQNAPDMEDTEMAPAEDVTAEAVFHGPMFQRDSRQNVRISRKRPASDIEQQQQQQQNKRQRTGAATGAWRQ